MKQASEHYLENGGKTYAEDRFSERLNFGRLYQSRYFRPYCAADRVLLDFGCATGLFLRNLPAARRIGVEVNPHSISLCEAACEEAKIPIELHPSLDLVADACVDVVISNHCLEHVRHPLAALEQMHRVLVAGGTLVLVLPFDDYRGRANRRWTAGDKDHHLYTWSPLNIGNLVSEAGFDVRRTEAIRFSWSPKIFWVHRVFGETAFRAAGKLLSRLRHTGEVFIEARKP